ncbi:glycine zipper 2TM domain-containing protein [Babesia caballi]|uniref:Glycine zipper 2TM domain-containing protein n=1 Tax=Babesia caballi TaxID=5871 RepID=A0AAV4LMP2_BABCB|nr:glycine zipper 2TM domain-containing protein [Babesia caballi]
MFFSIPVARHKCAESTTIGTIPLPTALITTLPIQVCQPVVIERQAAEEDLGSFVISRGAVPILTPENRLVAFCFQLLYEAFSTVVNGGCEDVLYGGAATVIKLFIFIFNLLHLGSEVIGLLPIRFDEGGKTGL